MDRRAPPALDRLGGCVPRVRPQYVLGPVAQALLSRTHHLTTAAADAAAAEPVDNELGGLWGVVVPAAADRPGLDHGVRVGHDEQPTSRRCLATALTVLCGCG